MSILDFEVKYEYGQQILNIHIIIQTIYVLVYGYVWIS